MNEHEIKKILGQKIKEYRLMRELSQSQLAELIKISPNSIGRIERGELFVNASTLSKLTEVLSVDVEDLFLNSIKIDIEKLHDENLKIIESIKNNENKLKELNRILKSKFL